MERAVRFNRETCRWDVLGEAADVRRSSERASILEVLKVATEALIPLKIAQEAEMPRPNVRQMLKKMVEDGEVLKEHRSRYAHPDNARFLDDKKPRTPKGTAITRSQSQARGSQKRGQGSQDHNRSQGKSGGYL